MDDKYEVAKLLLEARAITLSPDKPYRYSSGILSPIYSDHRQVMGYPAIRRRIAQLLSDKIKELDTVDFISATATGAIPHGAWVAELLDLPLVYIRNKPKDHGKQNLIEGFFEKNQRTVIVEDLISTGQSAIASALAVREANCQVDNVVAITTYKLPQADINFTQNNLILHTLTDFPTIIDVASKNGYIKASETQLVLKWQQDPSEWAKNNNISL